MDEFLLAIRRIVIVSFQVHPRRAGHGFSGDKQQVSYALLQEPGTQGRVDLRSARLYQSQRQAALTRGPLARMFPRYIGYVGLRSTRCSNGGACSWGLTRRAARGQGSSPASSRSKRCCSWWRRSSTTPVSSVSPRMFCQSSILLPSLPRQPRLSSLPPPSQLSMHCVHFSEAGL